MTTAWGLLEVVELPRRRGDEKDAALREKEGLRSLLAAAAEDDEVGMAEVLFACDRGGGLLGWVVGSGPSRVTGLEEVVKEAAAKMSAEGGGRCMVWLRVRLDCRPSSSLLC